MKISKLYTVLAGLVAIMALNSCEDALDMAPAGYLSIQEIFQDNDKTSAYLNSCYEYIPEGGASFWQWSRGIVNWSDEAWDSDAASGLISESLYKGSASASYHPIVNISEEHGNGNYWNRYWAAIRKCAVFVSNIDGANVASAADKKRWKAEAHVLRAYYYSELLRWYGTGLPIIREAYTLDTDFGQVEKPSYYETVKFILEDCDAALAIAELPWRITTDAEAARVTSAMAEAIKSRMIVFAASPLYNGGNNYWEEAYTVNKQALANLKSHGYELYTTISYPGTYKDPDACFPNDYAALYNEYFTQVMAYSPTPADKETIYQNKAQQIYVPSQEGIGINCGKSGTCPSQELVDAYETTNGETILDLSKPYIDEKTHLEPNYNKSNTLYNPDDPYINRDPRLYGSVYYHGSERKCYWVMDEDPLCYENYPAPKGDRRRFIATYPEEPFTGLSDTKQSGTRTGYYIRKFLHPFASSTYNYVGANTKMFRLGETILNFAEAAAEAGHLDEAIAAVNELRARVGMPGLTTMSKEALILRIRNERRVELGLEGFRYYDVRRWSLPTEDLSNTDRFMTAMRVKRNVDGSGNFTHYSYSRQSVGERLCYANRYLWIPIPVDEANIMEALTGVKWQNPGW